MKTFITLTGLAAGAWLIWYAPAPPCHEREPAIGQTADHARAAAARCREREQLAIARE